MWTGDVAHWVECSPRRHEILMVLIPSTASTSCGRVHVWFRTWRGAGALDTVCYTVSWRSAKAALVDFITDRQSGREGGRKEGGCWVDKRCHKPEASENQLFSCSWEHTKYSTAFREFKFKTRWQMCIIWRRRRHSIKYSVRKLSPSLSLHLHPPRSHKGGKHPGPKQLLNENCTFNDSCCQRLLCLLLKWKHFLHSHICLSKMLSCLGIASEL